MRTTKLRNEVVAGLGAAALIGLSANSYGKPNPEGNAYLDETHVHTDSSLDAWLAGNMTGPAYKYCKGASQASAWL